MPGGVWRNWVSDEVFALGRYVGSAREREFRGLYADAVKVLDSMTQSVL